MCLYHKTKASSAHLCAGSQWAHLVCFGNPSELSRFDFEALTGFSLASSVSPIMEQSPPDDKSSAGQPASSLAARAGTILGEGLAAHQPSASSATSSFGDRTAPGPSASVGEDAVASVWAPASPPFAAPSPEKECGHLSDADAASQPARLLSGPRSGDLDADFPSEMAPTPLADQNVARGAQVDHSLYGEFYVR